MNKMKKLLVGAAAAGMLLAATAGPAFAIVDPFTPADECSGREAVGEQGALNGLNLHVKQVSAPVPSNNPGVGLTPGDGASLVIACP